MLKEERQAYIIKQINLHNKVLSSDLSEKLVVSEDTIRRDLNDLADAGKILKVHGGALSKSFHYPFHDTDTYAKEGKKEIARKVLSLIKDGMLVLVSGGTTMIELARMIPDRLACTFFTVSPLVAIELVEYPNVTVILLGGNLSKNAQISVGSAVISQLADIKFDLCLLTSSSFSLKDGVTDSDWEVVQVKKAMVKAATKTALIGIAEKLDTIQKLKVCDLNALDYLVTELSPDDEKLHAYADIITIV
ncbi:DeoR/GlpR family DNA-binding transcription regulator [Pedobacter arcticus]|uniref:DeoR/GlpR family DNA-binding transcription regulator n=1 Tax=Pedobacter arcticus TaxID=752140 RepID=UPI0003180085|nr:DeoR/GlpR family DNA-binding transcription regulator [Pedobacter arcticus]